MNEIWFDFSGTARPTKFESISHLIRALLWANGMSEKELATKAQLSDKYLSEMLNGYHVNMPVLTMNRICKALHCDVNFFISVVEENLK